MDDEHNPVTIQVEPQSTREKDTSVANCTCPSVTGVTSTVKPVLRDHYHERPPVLTDHTFLAEGLTFLI